ncbi:MAG: PTS sugar transporter subunit IIB [Actinomycetia bacterium]|nr:PTS sugar transporter subunit IIB [Actinomycetes bacterium]
MKIITVCGMGIGTSALLRMTTVNALRALGVEHQCEVLSADIGTARTVATPLDVVFTSAAVAQRMGPVPARVVIIRDSTNLAEITAHVADLASPRAR